MRFNNTEASVNFSSRDLQESQFSCQYTSDFTLYFNDTIALQSTLAVTSIVCPATILLNALVIIAVRRKRELQRNSNILLCSLAIADLLVGSASMPLNIVFGAIVLQKTSIANFCTLYLISAVVLEVACTTSLYLLTAIAWERYMAITRWIEYKVTVTRSRVKKHSRIAWLIALLTGIVQYCVLETPGLDYTFPDIVPIIVYCLPSTICLIAIVYFYIKIFLEVCKRKLNQISPVSAIVKAKQERKVAKTTALLTVVVLCSFAPSVVMGFVGYRNPALYQSAIFLWTQVLAQLNSLVNPVLYCFTNPLFRNAVLGLLKVGQPDATQKTGAIVGRIRQTRNEQQPTNLSKSRSCDAGLETLETARGKSHGRVTQRPKTAPSLVAELKVAVKEPREGSSARMCQLAWSY